MAEEAVHKTGQIIIVGESDRLEVHHLKIFDLRMVALPDMNSFILPAAPRHKMGSIKWVNESRWKIGSTFQGYTISRTLG